MVIFSSMSISHLWADSQRFVWNLQSSLSYCVNCLCTVRFREVSRCLTSFSQVGMIVASIYAILGVHFYAETSEENFGTFSRAIYTVSVAVSLIRVLGLTNGDVVHLFSFVISCFQTSLSFVFLCVRSLVFVILSSQHLFLLSSYVLNISLHSLVCVCNISFFRHFMFTTLHSLWFYV